MASQHIMGEIQQNARVMRDIAAWSTMGYCWSPWLNRMESCRSEVWTKVRLLEKSVSYLAGQMAISVVIKLSGH